MATIPSKFRAGDFVSWTDEEAPVGSQSIQVYLRTNAPSGAVISGTVSSGVWAFEISQVTSAALLAGSYLAQFVATVSGRTTTYREERFSVLPSLAFTGSATAFETRSKLEIDLDELDAKIKLIQKAQEYQVGMSGGSGFRRVTRANLDQMLALRENLVARIAREKRAEAIASGKPDPDTLYTVFSPV